MSSIRATTPDGVSIAVGSGVGVPGPWNGGGHPVTIRKVMRTEVIKKSVFAMLITPFLLRLQKRAVCLYFFVH
jgi:hypothetical protein